MLSLLYYFIYYIEDSFETRETNYSEMCGRKCMEVQRSYPDGRTCCLVTTGKIIHLSSVKRYHQPGLTACTKTTNDGTIACYMMG